MSNNRSHRGNSSKNRISKGKGYSNSNNSGKSFRKNKICKYFSTGSCRLGNKCRFLHVIKEEDEPVSLQSLRHRLDNISKIIVSNKPVLHIIVLYAEDEEVRGYSEEVRDRFLEKRINCFLQIQTYPKQYIKPEHLVDIINRSTSDFLVVVGDKNMKNRTLQIRYGGKLYEKSLQDALDSIQKDCHKKQKENDLFSVSMSELNQEKCHEMIELFTGIKHILSKTKRINSGISSLTNSWNKTDNKKQLFAKFTSIMTNIIRWHKEICSGKKVIERIYTIDAVDRNKGINLSEKSLKLGIDGNIKKELVKECKRIITHIENIGKKLTDLSSDSSNLWTNYFMEYQKQKKEMRLSIQSNNSSSSSSPSPSPKSSQSHNKSEIPKPDSTGKRDGNPSGKVVREKEVENEWVKRKKKANAKKATVQQNEKPIVLKNLKNVDPPKKETSIGDVKINLPRTKNVKERFNPQLIKLSVNTNPKMTNPKTNVHGVSNINDYFLKRKSTPNPWEMPSHQGKHGGVNVNQKGNNIPLFQKGGVVKNRKSSDDGNNSTFSPIPAKFSTNSIWSPTNFDTSSKKDHLWDVDEKSWKDFGTKSSSLPRNFSEPDLQQNSIPNNNYRNRRFMIRNSKLPKIPKYKKISTSAPVYDEMKTKFVQNFNIVQNNIVNINGDYAHPYKTDNKNLLFNMEPEIEEAEPGSGSNILCSVCGEKESVWECSVCSEFILKGINVPRTYFCSNVCQQGNFKTHNVLHKKVLNRYEFLNTSKKF